MEMAGEADDLALAREGARHAQCQQRGFGAGKREAYALGRRKQFANELRPFDLERVRSTVVRALPQLFGDGGDHAWMIVAQDEGAVAAEIIDVLISVGVPFVRAVGPLDVDRMRLQVSAGVRHAVGQQRFGALVERSAARRLRGIRAQNL